MGTTADFVKLRSSKAPKTGEWNINYAKALALAKKEYKFVVAAWSNGDACGYCVSAEKCMLTATFKNWLKKQDAYFVFQYSGDKDKGQTVKDWLYKDGGLKMYPGFRVTLYSPDGKIAFDQAIEGNKLRGSKAGENGAKEMIKKLEAMFAKKPAEPEPVDPEPVDPEPAQQYKVRLNEKLTTAQVNKILDAIDKNDGYCPCQPKGEGTKCHCEDFVKEKGFDEPCICRIYVKKPL